MELVYVRHEGRPTYCPGFLCVGIGSFVPQAANVVVWLKSSCFYHADWFSVKFVYAIYFTLIICMRANLIRDYCTKYEVLQYYVCIGRQIDQALT
jgi:hypothetical protein